MMMLRIFGRMHNHFHGILQIVGATLVVALLLVTPLLFWATTRVAPTTVGDIVFWVLHATPLRNYRPQKKQMNFVLAS
jgi:hypothetical protein